MRKTFWHIFAVSLVAVLFSTFVFAQRDRTVASNYVISAKAGGVNLIEGNVTIVRKDGRNGYLIKGDTVEIGDKVRTGANGKAEILLNPGSYVRLAENSEFEFTTVSLDDLRLALNSGSAMLEVFADRDYSVSVATPNAQFIVVKSGVYRVDVLSKNSSKLEVWEGRAQIGATEAKSGRAITVSDGQMAIAKFDRDEKDALEIWSKSRAKELARINERLERRALRDTLVSSFHNSAWNMYNSFGLWIYDASFSGHCFFPFGYGWRSPYGFGFGWNAWNIRLPYYVYQPPVNQTVNGNNNTDRQRARINPPFQDLQNDVGSSPVNQGTRTPRDIDFPASSPTSLPTSRPTTTVTVAPSGDTGTKRRN